MINGAKLGRSSQNNTFGKLILGKKGWLDAGLDMNCELPPGCLLPSSACSRPQVHCRSRERGATHGAHGPHEEMTRSRSLMSTESSPFTSPASPQSPPAPTSMVTGRLRR